MKRALFLFSALFITLSAVAQEYTTHHQSLTVPQTLLPVGYIRLVRNEITLPTINGYTPYKADLHIHSTLTDGVVNIEGRLEEAWSDGLDVIAEGIETNKRNFTRFLILAHGNMLKEVQKENNINKSSLVFVLPHKEGSLSQVLSVLSFYDVNLTRKQL